MKLKLPTNKAKKTIVASPGVYAETVEEVGHLYEPATQWVPYQNPKLNAQYWMKKNIPVPTPAKIAHFTTFSFRIFKYFEYLLN